MLIRFETNLKIKTEFTALCNTHNVKYSNTFVNDSRLCLTGLKCCKILKTHTHWSLGHNSNNLFI